VIYGTDKAQHALANFFKEPTLAALREMALRQTAHEIDIRHEEQGVNPSPERILIHITESPATAAVIRRGKRVADYLKAECFAVGVLPSPNPAQLDRHLDFARKLRIETRVLESEDPAEALFDFARRNGVTQIFLAKPPKRSIPFLGKRPLVMDIVRLAKDRQITVVAERKHV
jgi:two-component system sensor histidine kinase KdpD